MLFESIKEVQAEKIIVFFSVIPNNFVSKRLEDHLVLKFFQKFW